MSTLALAHIEIDANGVAWIVGANTKVLEVALDKIAYGWSPEEIHFQHPHLSLAQIHSALAYYYDHQQEIDAEIERRRGAMEELAARDRSPLRERLLAIKNQKKRAEIVTISVF